MEKRKIIITKESKVKFTEKQKQHIIILLDEHWNKFGDSSTYEGIKMAKRVIRKL